MGKIIRQTTRKKFEIPDARAEHEPSLELATITLTLRERRRELLPTVVLLLQRSKDPLVRWSAIQAVKKMKYAPAIPALRKILRSTTEEPGMVQSAHDALHSIQQ